MNILSVQSQVVYGHVGNSAAGPALQALGAEVWAVPTALLSHHPGHGAPAGGLREPSEVAALLAGLEKLGLFAAINGVLSGYLGRAQSGETLLAALDRIGEANPGVLYLCDPVMGDGGRLYVEPELPDFFRAKALPRADILTPNRFELGLLGSRPVSTFPKALAAARALRQLGPKAVVCTGLELEEGTETRLGTLGVSGEGAWLIATPRLENVPQGSGDLLAALLLGLRLKGAEFPAALARAVSATYAVLKRSSGEPEMRLIETLGQIAAPAELFPPAPVT